jgi:hypothetical protein
MFFIDQKLLLPLVCYVLHHVNLVTHGCVSGLSVTLHALLSRQTSGPFS